MIGHVLDDTDVATQQWDHFLVIMEDNTAFKSIFDDLPGCERRWLHRWKSVSEIEGGKGQEASEAELEPLVDCFNILACMRCEGCVQATWMITANSTVSCNVSETTVRLPLLLQAQSRLQ